VTTRGDRPDMTLNHGIVSEQLALKTVGVMSGLSPLWSTPLVVTPLVCGDGRLMFLDSVRDPQQLQPTWDRVTALMAQTQKQQQSAKARK